MDYHNLFVVLLQEFLVFYFLTTTERRVNSVLQSLLKNFDFPNFVSIAKKQINYCHYVNESIKITYFFELPL